MKMPMILQTNLKSTLLCIAIIAIGSIPGCGPKYTLRGDDFSAHPELLSRQRIMVTEVNIGYRFRPDSAWTTTIVRSLSQQLPSTEIVMNSVEMRHTFGWLAQTPEEINPDSLAAFGKQFNIDAIIFCTSYSEPIGFGKGHSKKRFNGENFSIHRLTMKIIDTRSARMIGYGSGILHEPYRYPAPATKRALADKVVAGIIEAVNSGLDK